MTAELTPWFGGEVKPEHVGPYERKIPYSNRTAFWYWNSEYWEYGGECTSLAVHRNTRRAPEQNLPWRGLVSDPAGQP